MGAVTMPPIAPDSASPEAVSIQRITAAAWAGEGLPATTWACTGRSSTGRAREKTLAACSADAMRSSFRAPAPGAPTSRS